MPVRNLPIEPLTFGNTIEVGFLRHDHVMFRHEAEPRERAILTYGIDGGRLASAAFSDLLSAACRSKACFYCGGPLATMDSVSWETDSVQGGNDYDVCQDCGFWRRNMVTAVSGWTCRLPVAREFISGAAFPALRELVRSVAARPEEIHSMQPRRFEMFVGSVLRDFFDCEVRHVGQTADGGVDLIALLGEEQHLIQVKRRINPESVEGVETVKLLFASAILRNSKRATVVTSAKRFTSGARAAAASMQMQGIEREFRMDLVSMAELLAMVRANAAGQGEPPYRQFKKRPKLSYGDDRISGTIALRDGAALFLEKPDHIAYFIVSADDLDALEIYTVSVKPDMSDIDTVDDMRIALVGAGGLKSVQSLLGEASGLSFAMIDYFEQYAINLPGTDVFDYSP